jgi:hypothetical protein
MNYGLAEQEPFAFEREEVRGRFNAYLLDVDFESPRGEARSTVGGGESVAEAIAAAREALPTSAGWRVARWNHIYGD